MKRNLVVAGIATTVGLAGISGAAIANAETSTNSATSSSSSEKTDPFTNLVDAIAKKFNLKTADVQAVFDEQRTAMEQEREASVKTQVAQLVKDGKLTQAQADKINTKRAELTKEREANRSTDQSQSRTDRKAQMEERRAALDTWLKDNNIDTQYTYLLMGGGHGHGGPDGPRGRNIDGNSQSSQNKDTTTNNS